MRVVTTTCSNTEIVCALGCGEWLVGIDDHSDYPAEALVGLPRVGPDLGIDVARVVSLRPDLVLASLTVPGHEKVVASLRAAGLPVVAPAPTSLTEVATSVREIAGLLHVAQRGELLAGQLEAALQPAFPSPEPPRLLVQWWPKPVIAPGRRSWVHDLIIAAGGVPALQEDVESRPLAEDEVRDLDPDAIVVSWCGVAPEKVRPEVIRHKAAWQNMRAVREGRIYCIPEAWLGRPSQRLIPGFRALRAVVDELIGGPSAPAVLRRAATLQELERWIPRLP